MQQELEAPAAEAETVDFTEQDLIAMRKKIYLIIMSSATADEITHKLLKLCHDEENRSVEHAKKRNLCNMLIETCANERTFVKDFGLVGEKFCRLSREFQDLFDESFAIYYTTIHRYDSSRLRNIARFFAWLFHSDSIEWSSFVYIRLTEQDTTSSSRIFIKTLLRVRFRFLFFGGSDSLTFSSLRFCVRSGDQRDTWNRRVQATT